MGPDQTAHLGQSDQGLNCFQHINAPFPHRLIESRRGTDMVGRTVVIFTINERIRFWTKIDYACGFALETSCAEKNRKKTGE